MAKSTGKSKAPNPKEYFEQITLDLLARDPKLYSEVRQFSFTRYDARSVTYSNELQERVVQTIGNPHGYAGSTLLKNIKAVAVERDRDSKRTWTYAQVKAALDESVKLQHHYATLLNERDGGERLLFKSSLDWLKWLDKLSKER